MYSITKLANMASALCLLTLAGCLGTPPAPPMPSYDPAGSSAKAFELYDANKDGKINGKELEKSASLTFALDELDINGDKAIDNAELTGRLQTYVDMGVARKLFTAQLVLDDAPLGEAEVKLIPEEFMLGAVTEGIGVSDAVGMVVVSAPDVDPPGLGVGFYRVQVSKKDAAGKEMVPAKFNADTTLGIELPASTRMRTSSMRTIQMKR
ncbi:MAG: hypothetical protein SGJ19_29465 [Planctomycetia bacterium]|nr:hypothetical protein [Planctomycetia bacterium]